MAYTEEQRKRLWWLLGQEEKRVLTSAEVEEVKVLYPAVVGIPYPRAVPAVG